MPEIPKSLQIIQASEANGFRNSIEKEFIQIDEDPSQLNIPFTFMHCSAYSTNPNQRLLTEKTDRKKAACSRQFVSTNQTDDGHTPVNCIACLHVALVGLSLAVRIPARNDDQDE